MGVCIDNCNKNSEKIITDSNIESNKKTEQSNYNNIISSNYFNTQEKNLARMKFKKMFSKANNNSIEINAPFILKIRQKNKKKKIQKFYRN